MHEALTVNEYMGLKNVGIVNVEEVDSK